MAIPKFREFIKPVLEYYSDEQEHTVNEVIENLAIKFNLSQEELNQVLSSGTQRVFDNRVGWAKTYLTKALLLYKTKRSVYKITQRGIEFLKTSPDIISDRVLQQFPEFKEFHNLDNNGGVDKVERSDYEITKLTDSTPEETLELFIKEINNQLESELLNQIKQCSPRFFEKLVVDLLLKMGYGGSRKDAGQVVGKTSDGGIDGIIKEDKLGLDSVYIQAKRWDDSTIGRPKIQEFAGALQGHKANKGVFITTSSFTNEARSFVANISNKIILLDGVELAKLMIEYNVGVSVYKTYEIKKIDNNYFSEE